MSLTKGGDLFVIAGYGSGGRKNDVWKTTDLTNWTQVLADGHGEFAERHSAGGVV